MELKKGSKVRLINYWNKLCIYETIYFVSHFIDDKTIKLKSEEILGKVYFQDVDIDRVIPCELVDTKIGSLLYRTI